MTDITERLRANGQSPWLAGMYRYVDDRRVSVRDDCAEAADEIERLRGLLREVRDAEQNCDVDDLMFRIDAALGAASQRSGAQHE